MQAHGHRHKREHIHTHTDTLKSSLAYSLKPGKWLQKGSVAFLELTLPGAGAKSRQHTHGSINTLCTADKNISEYEQFNCPPNKDTYIQHHLRATMTVLTASF